MEILGKRGDLMVGVLDSESSGPGSVPRVQETLL